MAKDSRRAGIAALVTLLAENFRQTVTTATYEAYCIGLDGLAVPQIEAAVHRALRTCKFMPSAAELREMSGELKPEDRAQVAWLALGRAIGEHGSYRTVDFDDRVINAVVRSLGGWEHVCAVDAHEFEAHVRREFLKAYTALRMATLGEEQTAPLPGCFDRLNAAGGHEPQQVRVVVTGLLPAPTAPRLDGVDRPKLGGAQ